MPVRTERLVTLEWKVTDRHAATFTPDEWAELMGQCRQPGETDKETLDRVADWLETRAGKQWLSELASDRNWIDRDDDDADLWELQFGDVDVVSA